MAKHDRKGRNKSGPPYVQLFHWIRKTEAWRSLAPYSRLLYIEIRGRYNGSNNGEIFMSVREAMELIGCSNKPAIASFKELEERGFIIATQKGAFDWKTHKTGEGRATRWLLTELPQDLPQRSLTPRYDFKNWKPKEEVKKISRVEKVHPMDVKTPPINDSMGVKSPSNGCNKSTHNGSSDMADGCKISTSYNIPYTPLTSKQPLSVSTALLDSLKRKGWDKPCRDQLIKEQESDQGVNLKADKEDG